MRRTGFELIFLIKIDLHLNDPRLIHKILEVVS